MSADNYYQVTFVADRWYVTMGFASEGWTVYPDVDNDPWFETYDEACDYALSEYTEYGVVIGTTIESLQVARRCKATEHLREAIDRYCENGDRDELLKEISRFVTVEGSS